MKIRRYLGSNTQEAILKVKMDLGNDAIILNTRKVRKKGLFSFFTKPMVEVLAAIDEDYGSKKEKNTSSRDEKKEVMKEEKSTPKVSEKDEKISELESKVINMESMLQKIYEQFQGNGNKQQAAASQQQDVQTVLKQDENKKESSKVLQLFHNNLVKSEIEADIAKKIMDVVREKLGENASMNEAASLIYKLISGMLGKPETINMRNDGKPTVVIFVGPTGVGKTTTLAKIAANYALNYKKKVGLITADTYRIAAVEQLKTYAEILGLPITVAYSAIEIKDAIHHYSDKELILIDTAGRSYRNKSQFEELKSLVLASEADEVYLVLSSTTSMRNCKEIVSNYSFLKDYKLIFTKLDETLTNGIILNTRHITGKKVSYITTGQCVPDDIEIANIDKITKNLLGSIT
ncbi:MAG: flagellar biosynthesis protein FlhF [Clostridia bacterium]|nr:flagellar biosynthesis protein FlhF [Clostridia bacterium]